MAWARLDDRFHEHWKVADAGLEAVGLWALCLTWASQARRTSPTPGVVPESVIARFAGGAAKGRRLAGRLRDVGMFDEKTPEGWPIHDFADYLPKYDADANRERGRRGGHAKAAKQTASKPLGEPPEESEAVGHENAKQTSGIRASVRRNPVPVPSEPKGSGRDDPPDGTDKIIGWWIDRHTQRPPNAVIAQAGKHVKALLAEGFASDHIRSGLTEMLRKGLNPSSLPSLVNAAANAPRDLASVPNIHRDIPPWECQ